MIPRGSSDDIIRAAPFDCVFGVKVPVFLFLVDFFKLFFSDFGVIPGHLFDFLLESFDFNDFFFNVCCGAGGVRRDLVVHECCIFVD